MTQSLGRADSITLESMEDGFELHITTDQGKYVVNVHGVTRDLIVAAGGVVDWYREGQELAAQHAAFRCDPDESGSYDRSDPKHPDWHSVHADLYDSREGK